MSSRPTNNKSEREQTNNKSKREPTQESPLAKSGVNASQKKIISFEDLAQGQSIVIIDFNGQHYRLRLTKSGRLVLTK